MPSFWKLTVVECKLYFRFPIMALFTLALPLMILILLGSMFGNEPSPMYGGYGSVDVSVPAYAAMIIAISAFISLPITLANYRERGILRRFRATPVSPAAVLGAQLVMQFVMTLLGMALLIVAGRLVFGLRFEGNALSVLAAFSLSCLSFFAFGMVLAGLIPSVRLASVVGNVLLQPMIYLSGATIPLEVMSPRMREFTRFIPLTHAVTLLRGLWVGDAWSEHQTELIVLSAILVVCTIVAVKVFRWE
ncbi:MAG: ABC transporter permease [Chloroflexi bacterium]|nr:ABC transporter permease [Chloroflexota bacterium]